MTTMLIKLAMLGILSNAPTVHTDSVGPVVYGKAGQSRKARNAWNRLNLSPNGVEIAATPKGKL